jgi:hypothetical protein
MARVSCSPPYASPRTQHRESYFAADVVIVN